MKNKTEEIKLTQIDFSKVNNHSWLIAGVLAISVPIERTSVKYRMSSEVLILFFERDKSSSMRSKHNII